MNGDAVLSSRVRLARNYEDLPFELGSKPELAAMCVTRTAAAIRTVQTDIPYDLLRIEGMTEDQRQSLCGFHLISADLLQHPETAAVLLRRDEAVSIMINEEDHLRIQSMEKGLDLLAPASRCFTVEDALSRQVSFAFDEQLGYLTACPTNTGTGMRASLLMHLPMLTMHKQMGNVGQIVAKVGLTIRGVYGEGSEALGDLYQVSNQVTLGRTEQELISAVTAVGHQLTDMENQLRLKTLQSNRVYLEDTVFRAWGILNGARIMPLKEFYKLWSNVRLGAVLGLLPIDAEQLNNLPEQAQDANLRIRTDKELNDTELPQARADMLRKLFNRSRA